MTDDEVYDLALTDPWAVAEIALTDKAEPSARREEAFTMAACHMAARQLVDLGCDLDAVLRNFETRPWKGSFGYDPEDERLTVFIEWLDNVNPPEMRPPT